MKFLNRKELKPIANFIKEHYGYTGSFDGLYRLSPKGRLFFAQRSTEPALLVEKLHVKQVGIYIGEWHRETFRFSLEGGHIFGSLCTKQIVDLDDAQAVDWMAGVDLPYSGDLKGIVLMRHGKDFLGCSKVGKEKLMNFIPKGRRVKIIAR